MKMKPLGRTGISVSELCLGSMTWGSQNSEAEAHAQIDFALDRGINFIDTAEIYPTTPRLRETAGRTEAFIGSWIKKSGRRGDIVLASKVAGKGSDVVRDGAAISGRTLRIALDDSLKRLKTDYLDLYQLHWPNRGSYHFRQTWKYDPSRQDTAKMMDETADILEAADTLAREGKIRALGLSNETVWGTAQYLRIAEARDWPRIASIQNEYSLLHRIFDTDFAELAHHEDVRLMAFSPLAAGMLTGKYAAGAVPEGSRKSMQPDLNGRWNEHSVKALDAYLAIAAGHGLDPAQMALAWALTRPFMLSVIIGATNMDQLKTDIGAADIPLTDEVMAEIQAVYRAHPLTM